MVFFFTFLIRVRACSAQCQDQHEFGWHCNHLFSTDKCVPTLRHPASITLPCKPARSPRRSGPGKVGCGTSCRGSCRARAPSLSIGHRSAMRHLAHPLCTQVPRRLRLRRGQVHPGPQGGHRRHQGRALHSQHHTPRLYPQPLTATWARTLPLGLSFDPTFG